MLLEILPSALYSLPNIDVLLRSNTSSIVFKSLSESLEDKKMYLSSIAVLLVMRGEQIVRNYDQKDLLVKTNEMVILPQDLYVVSDFVTKEGVFEAFIFFIDEQLIEKYLLLNSTKKEKKEIESVPIKAPISRQVAQFIRSMREVYNTDNNNNKLLLEIKVLEFLLLLEIQQESQSLINTLINPIKKRNISKFMEQNYLSNLKISDYALLTGRSDSTFNRDFKRLYGTTPKKWLTQVSLEVGYENVSHFIEAYKKEFSVTPNSTLRNSND